MPKLVALTPGLNALTFEVTPERSSVGRLDDNRFPVPEASVSSHHCEVWLKGDDIMVKDLNSTNGTFVNDVQVAPEKEVAVRPGQTLRLGQVDLRHETGKKQSDQPRQTVKLGDASSGGTMVMTKGAGFGKKENKVNKIFIIVGVVLALIIVGALLFSFMHMSS
jgi:pSer/pThr/pTyr-binding forkhead associated (FHA) protein